MAALTMQAVISADGIVTVTRSTDDAIGSATAAVIFDDTATWFSIDKALRALRRAVDRNRSAYIKPSEVPTSGTSVE